MMSFLVYHFVCGHLGVWKDVIYLCSVNFKGNSIFYYNNKFLVCEANSKGISDLTFHVSGLAISDLLTSHGAAVLIRVPDVCWLCERRLLGSGNHGSGSHGKIRPTLEIHTAGNQHTNSFYHILHLDNP